jgi:chitodextrinase
MKLPLRKCIHKYAVTTAAGALLLAVSGIGWFKAQQSEAQSTGLVAAYSFNEGAGTVVTDLSGNGNNGSIVGASWTTAGKYGNALSFNGTSSYVDLGNPSSLHLTGSMTLSAWVKAAGTPADDGGIVTKSDSGPGWQLKTSPDTGPETFGVAVSGAGASRTQRYSNTIRSLNTWYYVAGVYNSSSRTIDIYVNGILDNGVLSGAVPSSQVNSGVNVYIGRKSSGNYFNGVIDEVRIYNRALTQSEIQADLNFPLGSPGSDSQAPTAPSSLSATAASASQINLAWASSTDNVGVTGYRVERCQGNGCADFTQIATTAGTNTTYSDPGLTASSTFSYRVRATDAAGNLSGYSPVAAATTQAAADTQAPTAPGALSATAVTGNQVNLSWNASTDNVGVTGYRVERCQGAGCSSFTEISGGSSAVPGPLKNSPNNPRYFVDPNGKPVLLTGSHTWNDLQDWGTNGTPQPLDFSAYVNFLQAHGQNFTLLWRTELTKFCGLPSTASSPPDFTVTGQPWQRTGPGTASDGSLKFDLSKFDQSFFDRLRSRVQQLNAAGIYAGVYLYSGEWLNVYRCSGDGYPLTGSNNINGVDDGGGTNSITMTAPNGITGVQDAYVNKVVDTLNDLPNVLWIVSEEAPGTSGWWNQHQIAQLRSYESTKPQQHPIGWAVMSDFNDMTLYNSNADWVAPGTSRSPSASCGSGTPVCKVNINDSDHSYFGMWNDTAQENRQYAWENFMSGNQVIFMDPYEVYYPRESRNLCVSPTNGICSAPDSRWDNFRDNLGYILSYSRKLNLSQVSPQPGLCSTGNCLAQTPATGAEYLVYAPSGGTFTVNLSATTRSLDVEWLNPSTGAITSAGTVTGGSSSRSFTAPFSGDAVLYLVDSAGHAGSSGTTPTTYVDSSVFPGAEYSYRVQATDAAGNLSSYSNVASVTTPSAADTTPPTAPADLSATAVSATQINLSWTGSTDDTGISGYAVERCQGATCSDFVQIGSPSGTGTTFDDPGLASNTSYRYRVRATDAAGNLGPYSNIASATTTGMVSGLVAAYSFDEGTGTTLTDLSGNGNNGTIVGANWTASGKYGNALSFNGTSSYVDLGNPASLQLTGSMTLSAWVSATGTPADDGGIVTKSDSGPGWQLKTSPDTGPETFGVAVSGPGSSRTQRYSNTIRSLNTWYYVAGVYNSSSRTIDFYVNGILDNGVLAGAVPSSQVNSGVNVYIGRESSGNYFSGVIDEVRIYNRALTQSEIQADMNAPLGNPGSDTQAPTAPVSLSATGASASQVNLAWASSTDNVGITGYRVERCQGNGCANFIQIATTTGATTSYNDSGLAASTTFSYRVRATDAAGNLGGYSPVAAATTQAAADIQPPTAPGALSATAVSGSQVNLSWNASTDNVGVTGYRVDRCPGATCSDFAQVGAPSGTTFGDAGLAANTTYRYRVSATDAAGNLSPYSNIANATTTGAITGLVGAYSFDEGSGSSVTDVSGNGNSGTITNATWTATGKYGSALVFNGSNARITIPDDASLRLTNRMTLEAWVNPSVVSASWRDVIYKGDDNYYLEATSTTKSRPAGGATGGTTVYGASSLAKNTWTHLAVTYDGANIRLFMNGTQVASATRTTDLTTSGNPLQIGGDSIYGQYFSGIIDEVRIYNVALSAAQIQSDMNSPVGTGSGGSSPPAVTLTPSAQDFGAQTVGTTSAAKGTTLTNTGGSDLTIGSISVTGANSGDFSQSNNCGTSVSAESSCTINITFAPTATGTRTANIAISDNASGSPQTIGLTGSGTTAASLSIAPRTSALTFTRTQQFTASNASGSVTWKVDGAAGGSSASGTITPAGVYTPPSSAGVHTITATDQVGSANATVYISNYGGTFTRDVDTLRTGLNSNETVLTPANVNAAQFGKLFSYDLDGVADASTLYVANVNIPGKGYHNVAYDATEHDSVYAFDADGLSATPLWKVSFINPGAGVTTVPPDDTGECCDISPEIGITGTPVIDPSSGTLYVVAKTKEVSGGSTKYVHRLHALDITTGAEKFGGPVVIQATVPGNGAGASGGHVAFDSLRENQRAALLLSDGIVYFAFAGHGDQPPYHGWVLGYYANTLQQAMVYNATPNGVGGGIWQSGDGLATDSSGDVYFVTGNGDFDANSGGTSYGDSIVRISPGGAVLDYFTPHDQASMQAGDLDLGSGGTLLLPDQSGPHPHLAISAGKNGTIYLVDRDNMGRYNANNDNQIVQSVSNAFPGGTFITGNFKAPMYFNGSVYFSADKDTIKSYKVINGMLSTSPTSETSIVTGYPGATLSMSSNGANNGILWVVERHDFDPVGGGGGPKEPGVLHAYDANDLTHELYNSNQAAGARDALDYAAKWSAALVANGKVFVATNSRLTVFSLLP